MRSAQEGAHNSFPVHVGRVGGVGGGGGPYCEALYETQCTLPLPRTLNTSSNTVVSSNYPGPPNHTANISLATVGHGLVAAIKEGSAEAAQARLRRSCH